MSGSSKDIDAALIIGFYVAVAVLVIRVRRFDLAVTALVLTALLAIALVVQATVSERLGGYGALGLTLTVGWLASPDDRVQPKEDHRTVTLWRHRALAAGGVTSRAALRLAVSIRGVGDVRHGGEGPDRAAS